MNREYCCTNCGLIWIDEKISVAEVQCPECLNTYLNLEYSVYACDTFGWYYAS